MGRPVVRFEVMGDDARALQSFYSELFEWRIDRHGDYGMVERDGNVNGHGVGTPGAVGAAPGVAGRVTFYVEVLDVEAALAEAERLGGSRLMGPVKVRGRVELGLLADPEGHAVGLIGEQDQRSG